MKRMGALLFEAIGAPPDEASIAASELVTSSLMGLDSHGVIRIPEYLDLARQGKLSPGAKITIERTAGATAIVDCGRNLGQVGAFRAMETAISLAREHRTSCVITRHCNHVGRLGAYVQAA